MKKIGPIWWVLAAIASVQLGSSVGKSLFDATSPLTVAWLRLAASGLLLTAIVRPTLRGRSRAAWGWLALYGFCLAMMNVTFYFAISRIPVGMAVTIEFLGPLSVALATSRRWRDLLWVLLAGAGVALLGLEKTTFDLLGIGLALAAGALWALYIVLAPKVGEHWRSVDALGLSCLAMAVVLLPFAAPHLGSALLDPRILLLGVGVGLMSSVIPYTLEMKALATMPRSLFAILMSLEPAAAALMAWLILGEFLRPTQSLGIGLVMAASVGATWFARRLPRPAPEG